MTKINSELQTRVLKRVLIVFGVLLVLTVVACVYFANTVKITM